MQAGAGRRGQRPIGIWRKLGRRLRIRPRIVEASARLRAQVKRLGSLPPGELDPNETGMDRDQLFVIKKVDELGPVFKVWWHSMYTTCIVGHSRARCFLNANRDRLPTRTIALDRIVPGGAFRTMNGEVHRHYRRVFMDALLATPRSSFEAVTRNLIRTGLAAVVAKSQGEPIAEAGLSAGLRDVTSGIMLRVLFGVEPDTTDFHTLLAGYRRYGPDSPVHRIGDAQVAAFADIKTCVQSLANAIESGEGEWGPSLLSHMVENGHADETAIGNLIHMFEPSHFDIYSLWRWITKYLAENPAVLTRLKEASASAGIDGKGALAKAVVLETLRLNQSEVLFRTVSSDTTVDGFFIPKGSNVRVCIWEGHKDATTFTEPFAFRPDRFLNRSYAIDEFAPFGLDGHRCIGADLVVGVSTTFVEELALSYCLAVVADGPPVFGEYHWQPSPQLKVRAVRCPFATARF
jgi:cytochrome P450